jgi:hypothetical protein
MEGISPSPSYKKLSSESEANTPRTPHSARFEDNMFFGKNFDIEQMSALSKQGAGKDILIHLLFIYCYGVLK